MKERKERRIDRKKEKKREKMLFEVLIMSSV